MRKLPKEGFRSITVKDHVYNYFYKKWKQREGYYQREHGVTSFAGFATWLLNRMLEQEQAENPLIPRFEHFNIYDDHAKIRDRELGLYIEVLPKPKGELYCKHCDSTDCVHVQYALTVPEIMERLKKGRWGRLW